MKENKKLGIRNFEQNRENPFIEAAVESINIVKKTQVIRPNNQSEVQMIVSEKRNKEISIDGYTQFLRFIEVDEDKFAKVYLSQFESFWELPKSAIRVFGYIINTIKPGRDKFEFLIDDALKYTKYKSKTAIYEGIVALCQNGIIARGYNEYIYFLNPMIVFNGNRVTFAKTYIKKKADILRINPNQTNLLDAIKEMGGKV